MNRKESVEVSILVRISEMNVDEGVVQATSVTFAMSKRSSE
jgi:hypothetical protein